MSWTIFKNKRAEAAEANTERIVALWKESVLRRIDDEVRLVEAHKAHVAAIESYNLQLQCEALRERTELKKAHAEEMNRVIEENKKFWDELTRVRYVENPALPKVQLNVAEDNTPPPAPKLDLPVGTSWQRVQKFYAEQQEAEARRRFTKPVETPVEGDQHGNEREGRQQAPLSEPSKTA